MSELWDELVNAAIEMDDQLGALHIPSSMGYSKIININDKQYTIRITVEENEDE